MTDLYKKVEWPEIQHYMDRPNYPRDYYYDPVRDCWFVPESEEPNYDNIGGEIGDLEDAMG